MAIDVGMGAALVGGILSFVSPCVLPLVPPYLGFMAGVSLDELQGRIEDTEPGHRQRQGAVQARVLFAAVAFVLGFAAVFVTLGATASTPRPDARPLSAGARGARRRRDPRHGPAFSRRVPHSAALPRGPPLGAAQARRPDRRLRHGARLRLRLVAVHRTGAGFDPVRRRQPGDGRSTARRCSPSIRSASAFPSCSRPSSPRRSCA